MIVDLFGIPGCGKTFYSKDLRKRMIKADLPCVDISRFNGMPLWLKICYKLADFAICLLPKYRKQKKVIKSLFISCENVKSKYVPFSLDYCINDIVLSTLIHDICNKLKIFCVNDEGQIQRYVFLMIQFGIPFDRLFSVYKQYNDNSFTIYLMSNVECAFSNIKNRNRHVCPMDEISDDILKMYLNDFYVGCELFRNNIGMTYSYSYNGLSVLSNRPLDF